MREATCLVFEQYLAHRAQLLNDHGLVPRGEGIHEGVGVRNELRAAIPMRLGGRQLNGRADRFRLRQDICASKTDQELGGAGAVTPHNDKGAKSRPSGCETSELIAGALQDIEQGEVIQAKLAPRGAVQLAAVPRPVRACSTLWLALLRRAEGPW